MNFSIIATCAACGSTGVPSGRRRNVVMKVTGSLNAESLSRGVVRLAVSLDRGQTGTQYCHAPRYPHGLAPLVYQRSTAAHQRGLVPASSRRSEEHTSELQSPDHLVCRLLLEKKKNT